MGRQTTPKKNSTERATLQNAHIERYYKKIVVGFLGFAILLIIAIVYFSFSKTTITVTSSELTKEISWTIPLSELHGVTVNTDVEGSAVIQVSTTTSVVPGKARGTVTLVNHSSKSQALVKTTRLLSREGILFRTQDTVTVPAGGSVDVTVEADQEGKDGNIEASRFEIVALWDGLKDKIYGESYASMTGGVINVTAISEHDVANALADVQKNLIEQALTRIKNERPADETLTTQPFNITDTMIHTEILTQESTAHAGDQVNSFTVTEKLRITAPLIDESILFDAVRKKINNEIPSGFILARDVTADDIQLTFVNLSTNKSDGDVTIEVTSPVHIGLRHPLLNPEKLTNRSKDEVIQYLSAFEEVQSVDVEFSPFWVRRTPKLADHILIVVK